MVWEMQMHVHSPRAQSTVFKTTYSHYINDALLIVFKFYKRLIHSVPLPLQPPWDRRRSRPYQRWGFVLAVVVVVMRMAESHPVVLQCPRVHRQRLLV